MTTKGDIRLIRAYAKFHGKPWRPLFLAFRDAPNHLKAAQRERMRMAVKEGRAPRGAEHVVGERKLEDVLFGTEVSPLLSGAR